MVRCLYGVTLLNRGELFPFTMNIICLIKGHDIYDEVCIRCNKWMIHTEDDVMYKQDLEAAYFNQIVEDFLGDTDEQKRSKK